MIDDQTMTDERAACRQYYRDNHGFTPSDNGNIMRGWIDRAKNFCSAGQRFDEITSENLCWEEFVKQDYPFVNSPDELKGDLARYWFRFEKGWLARARLESETLKAADELANKLDEICANESYKSVWTIAHVHGLAYTGPTFEKELKAYRKLRGEE